MERLSQLHGPCEIEHDMGAFYSVVLLVSWLSRLLPWALRSGDAGDSVMRPSTAQI